MQTQRALPGLERAIRAGGICHHTPGRSKTEVLAALVERVSLPADLDRRRLLEMLLARETLGSTAVGDGVAFPHLRDPGGLHIPAPSVTVCFLDRPVEFGALDGKPVHTLLAVISPTVRVHLHLLSLLSYGLRREEFRAVILSQATPAAVLAAARVVDEALRLRAERGEAGGA